MMSKRIRDNKSYHHGQRAYKRGKNWTACPYKTGGRVQLERTSWLTGWLDNRTNSVLGHIFKKYETTFP